MDGHQIWKTVSSLAEQLRKFARPALGVKGERRAARYLRRRGFKILHRNYRVGDDEADLIALDPDQKTVVIVEVKTRRSAVPAPELSIGFHKRRKLIRLGTRMARQPSFASSAIRFDAVTIIWPKKKRPEIRHYPAAFDASG